jgi:mannose-1-phosphate guanylyltransferase
MILPPALVLTAGLGTRLRPLTYVRAKAAVPVNGDTLARRIVRWLVSEGITDLVLNLHHLPATVAASIGDGGDLGARIRYSWENPVLGSAGGPRHALQLLADPGSRSDPGSRIPHPGTFFIVNGDTLTDVQLDPMFEHHRASGARVTMALIPNPRPDKYGGVVVSGDSRITGFVRAGSRARSFHFIGVQIAEASVFAELEDGVPAESVNTLYPRLIQQDPKSVGAFVCAASFRDIGTPADYLETSLQLARTEGDRLISACGARIDAHASIVRTAVWDDVRIGPDAELTECIVADGVTIPPGAVYRRVALVQRPDETQLLVHPID